MNITPPRSLPGRVPKILVGDETLKPHIMKTCPARSLTEDAESQDDRESHIGKNCNNAPYERFTTQQFTCGHRTVKYRISHTAMSESLDILSQF